MLYLYSALLCFFVPGGGREGGSGREMGEVRHLVFFFVVVFPPTVSNYGIWGGGALLSAFPYFAETVSGHSDSVVEYEKN